jgi:hypothetical protein
VDPLRLTLLMHAAPEADPGDEKLPRFTRFQFLEVRRQGHYSHACSWYRTVRMYAQVPTEEQVEAGTHTTFSAKHMLSRDRPIPDALLAMGRVDCMPAAELAERVRSSGMQKVVDDLQKGKVFVWVA